MAQYKVPQDVEADDKLLGPFSFRQLIYLFLAGGFGFLAFVLFKIFPLLAIIPIPFVIFFCVLALPIKKDQPMETYLAALVSFYFKPNKRFWNPGQRDFTITITAPKKLEGPRVRALSEDEASSRLSFLADVIDSGGRSMTGNWSSAVKEEYKAEASSTPDMFEAYDSEQIGARLNNTTATQHQEAVQQMRAAIDQVGNLNHSSNSAPRISHNYTAMGPSVYTVNATQPLSSNNIIQPLPASEFAQTPKQEDVNPAKTIAMEQLANNPDYSVATIAKEADRIKKKNINDDEIYISLR